MDEKIKKTSKPKKRRKRRPLFQLSRRQRRHRVLKTVLLGLLGILILAAFPFVIMQWDTAIEEGEVVTDTDRLTAASTNHSAWIKDGKLYVAGNTYENQEAISDWKYLVQVSISDNHIVALNHSGIAYATGSNASSQCEINGLENVRYIEAGMGCSIAVMEDGTVEVFGIMEPEWRKALDEETEVSMIAVGNDHMAVLHNDGTVTAYGNNENGKCDVKKWKKIRQISVGNTFTVGLTSKGRIKFAGTDANNSDFSVAWENMVNIEAGNSHMVAIDQIGTVWAIGLNTKGECNVSGWEQVTSVAAGYDHTIALKENGEVLAVGYNGNGQCNVYY